MITFKTIRWKNLLSTGNTFTEIDLSTFKSSLIVGDNGAGKSTILDALSFALYGKPFRKVNKPQLINSINQKHLLVEVEFVAGNKQYLVRRGQKPSVFEIHQNGTLINQSADSADYQEMLEKNVLKMNHKSFSQIVVLGSASFVPFMQLSAAHRREIIEDLLDIQIFTTMNTLLKDRVTQNKSDILEIDYKLENLENTIEIEQQHLNTLKQNNADLIKQKTDQINYYVSQINDVDQQTSELLKELQTLQTSIQDQPKTQARLEKVLVFSRQIENKIDKIQKETEFFSSHHDCPTCRQGIADGHRTSIVEAANTKLKEIAEGKTKVDEELQRLQTRLSEIYETQQQITTLQTSIQANQIQSNSWAKFVESLKTDMAQLSAASKFEDNKDRLKELKTEQQTLQQSRTTMVEQRILLDVASVMLKDGGIKTKIIKQYIPIINKLINKYLAAMDFFVNFELNENFEEKIKSRFRDEFSYASFSEGEKSRLDLALLFTWRAVAKLRNSASTNLLILDEVFDGSLDNTGNDELLKILQSLTAGNNVFVISHKTDAFLDKFERVLKFEKVKNFSRIVDA